MKLFELLEAIVDDFHICVYDTDNFLVYSAERGDTLTEEIKNKKVKDLEAGYRLKDRRIIYEIIVEK